MQSEGYKPAISGAEILKILPGWQGLNVTPSAWRQQGSQSGRPPHRRHALKMDK